MNDKIIFECKTCGTKYSVDISQIPVMGKLLKCKKCSDSIVFMKPDEYYMQSFTKELAKYIVSRKANRSIIGLENDVKRIIYYEKYLNKLNKTISESESATIEEFMSCIAKVASLEQVDDFKKTLSDLYNILLASEIIRVNPMSKSERVELDSLYDVDDFFNKDKSQHALDISSTSGPQRSQKEPPNNLSPLMECPYCREEIPEGSSKCTHCDAILVTAQTKDLDDRIEAIDVSFLWKDVFRAIQSFKLNKKKLGIPSFVHNSQGVQLTPWRLSNIRVENGEIVCSGIGCKNKIGIFSVLAFLFGPIYYFVKGMWRKGLTSIAAILTVSLVLVSFGLEEVSLPPLGFYFGLMAKYDYYRMKVLEEKFWW